MDLGFFDEGGRAPCKDLFVYLEGVALGIKGKLAPLKTTIISIR